MHIGTAGIRIGNILLYIVLLFGADAFTNIHDVITRIDLKSELIFLNFHGVRFRA